MPEPLAICLEQLQGHDGRFVQCVALPGRQPGLRVSVEGQVLWKSEDAVACELWVSADDRLILFRPAGARDVLVEREGRSLDVPEEKPVVLIDQDLIHVGARSFRVHVHGETDAVRAPSVLARASRVAAMVALGAAVAGCNRQPVEVRETPPAVAVQPDGPPPDPTADAGQDAAGAASSSASPVRSAPVPIEVRSQPPGPPKPR